MLNMDRMMVPQKMRIRLEKEKYLTSWNGLEGSAVGCDRIVLNREDQLGCWGEKLFINVA